LGNTTVYVDVFTSTYRTWLTYLLLADVLDLLQQRELLPGRDECVGCVRARVRVRFRVRVRRKVRVRVRVRVRVS